MVELVALMSETIWLGPHLTVCALLSQDGRKVTACYVSPYKENQALVVVFNLTP